MTVCIDSPLDGFHHGIRNNAGDASCLLPHPAPTLASNRDALYAALKHFASIVSFQPLIFLTDGGA